MKKLAFILVVCVVAACGDGNSKKSDAPAYDVEYIDSLVGTFEQRTDSLLAELTLEEKVSLMMNSSAPVPRLGIKKYDWWNEALHGVARNGSATVFPQAIGMAASFDDELLYEVFTVVSDEARVKHRMADQAGDLERYQGLTFWTPNINIFRDPRWGRGMETYGEDPYLMGVLGVSVVKGLQGDDNLPIRKAHACAKHYAVHSGPESNRHSFDVSVSERDLRETYLPAFKDLVVKGGVEEVMTAYNRVDGVPAGANDRLINEILRGEWGYKGIITSDCWAVPDFYEPGRHGYSPDAATAAAIAVKTGMDTECGESFAYLLEAVERGLITEEEIDVNLRRLLLTRFRLGEMDGVSLWDHLSDDIVDSEEHKALALKMAYETMTLLQNNGVLPLKADSRIAVVGPNADDEDMMWGNYNPIPKETITLLEAVREYDPNVKYIRGCGILGYEHRPMPDPNHPFAKYVDMTDEEIDALAASYAIDTNTLKQYVERQQKLRSNFEPALDVKNVLYELQDVDIVIFAGGISPEFEGEEMPVQVPGFSGGDRTSIELPQVQRELIETLHNDGKKVVLVNFSGSAVGLVPESENCDAILQAWYPGQMGGTAIADVLFGKANPSGKLPLTFYKSVDQLPHFENYDMEGHTYRYFCGEPLFPFGHGLSYTTFEYGKASVKGGKLVIPVKNTGSVAGDEVVQLYIRRPDDPAGPIKTLRGFQRVTVAPGKTVNVEIPLTEETFLWWDEAAQDMTPLHGEYELMYGGSSADSSLTRMPYTY